MKRSIRFLCFMACFSWAGLYAQNAPLSMAGTVVSLGSQTTVPLLASDFTNVSSCNLMLSYDPAIALATNVTIGPGLGGLISSNLTTPGIIILGWFTAGGINLPDSSVIFNISFSKTGNGITSITWIDNGNSCTYNDGSFNSLNDLPFSDYYMNGTLVFQSPEAPVTMIPQIEALPGTGISIPVSVTGFQFIGSLSLNLHYDPEVLDFLSFNNDSGYPNLTIDNSQPGILLVDGIVPIGDTAYTLSDNSSLFSLNFNYLGGFTELTWIDNGPSCEYGGSLPVYPVLSDIPQATYYVDGSVASFPMPGAAGIITGPTIICIGTSNVSYTVPVIENAIGYVWEVPDGASIVAGQNTNSILVDFSVSAISGAISVFGTNTYGNGIPTILGISILPQPGTAGLISGLSEVCNGQDGVNYSVMPIANATGYNWSIPYGAYITDGINTNSITVSYGSSSVDGEITVSGSNNCGFGLVSDPFHVMVNTSPEIINQPENTDGVIAGSGTGLFTLLASGTGLLYRWQEFVSIWNDLSENEMYVGVFTDTLQVVNPSSVMNGNRYRCVVSGTCDPTAFTDGYATLVVLNPVGLSGTFENVLTLNAYPNPFTEFINIEVSFPVTGSLKIELQNLSGQTIELFNESVSLAGNQLFKINTNKLYPGLYTIVFKLQTENHLMIGTQKIICNH